MKSNTTIFPKDFVKKNIDWKSEVSFDGDGYMDLNKKIISHNVDMKWELKVKFSTWISNGLLIWRGKQKAGLGGAFFDDDQTDLYVALGIQNSNIVFVSNGIEVNCPSGV